MVQMAALKLAWEMSFVQAVDECSVYGQAWSFDAAANYHVQVASQHGEKMLNFQCYVIRLRKEHNYFLSQVGSAAQTPVYFKMPMDMNLEKRSSNSISVLTGRNTKLRCTVMR